MNVSTEKQAEKDVLDAINLAERDRIDATTRAEAAEADAAHWRAVEKAKVYEVARLRRGLAMGTWARGAA